MNSAITQRWLQIRSWYAEQLPEVAQTLNPSATEAPIQAFDAVLQQTIGQGLPRELREVYAHNDGQNLQATSGLFFGLTFLSVSDAYEQWRNWREIAERDPELADETEFASSYPPGAINPEYVNLGRIPFAYDWGGNHLGIDLHPGPQGQTGQVINFGRDEGRKYVVAPSLGAFLAWHLTQLREGNYRLMTSESEGQSERVLELLEPPNSHFLDAVPELFGPKRPDVNASFSASEQLFTLCIGRPTRIFEGDLPDMFASLNLPEKTRVVASYLAEDPGREGQAAAILETPLSDEDFRLEAGRLFEAEGWNRVAREASRLLFTDDTGDIGLDFWPVDEMLYFVKDGWALVLAVGDMPFPEGAVTKAILQFEYQRGIEVPRVPSGGLLELFPQLRLPKGTQTGFQGGSWEPGHVEYSATLTTELGLTQLAEHFMQQLVAVDWEVSERLTGEQIALITLERRHGKERYGARLIVSTSAGPNFCEVSVDASKRR